MNDPQPFFLDSAQISLRLAEAKKSRQMIKWLGYDILLSDLPVDCNDAEYPLCESFCCNCHERMWVFPTMQTSCQICGHDWQDGLWVSIDSSLDEMPLLDPAIERDTVLERQRQREWFDRAKAACQHHYDTIRAVRELTGGSIVLQEIDRKMHEAAIARLEVLAERVDDLFALHLQA